MKDEQRLALQSFVSIRHRAQGRMGAPRRVIDIRTAQSTATETTPLYEKMNRWVPRLNLTCEFSLVLVRLLYGSMRQHSFHRVYKIMV